MIWPSSLARSIGIVADRDAARLHHREPAGDEHRLVGGAQQHAVAGNEAALGDEHVGDAVGLSLQLGVRPRRAAGRADAAPVAAAFPHVAIEQLGGAVQPLGELQLGQLEAELGLRLGRGQVVAGEGVDVGGRADSRRRAQVGWRAVFTTVHRTL